MTECTDCDGFLCPSCSPDECADEALAEAWDVAANDAEQAQISNWKEDRWVTASR